MSRERTKRGVSTEKGKSQSSGQVMCACLPHPWVPQTMDRKEN
jgi:hypothetical protein